MEFNGLAIFGITLLAVVLLGGTFFAAVGWYAIRKKLGRGTPPPAAPIPAPTDWLKWIVWQWWFLVPVGLIGLLITIWIIFQIVINFGAIVGWFNGTAVLLLILAAMLGTLGFYAYDKGMKNLGPWAIGASIASLILAFVVLLGFWDRIYSNAAFVITRWVRTGFAMDQDLLPLVGGLLLLAILLFVPDFRKVAAKALGILIVPIFLLAVLTYWLGTDHVMRGGNNLGAAFERATLQAGVVTSSGNWVDYTAPPKGSAPAVVPVGFGYTCFDGNKGKTYLLFKKDKGTKDFRYEIVSLTDSPVTASILISTSKAERDNACPLT